MPDDDIRGKLNGLFGHDFSSVKVHTDANAQQMNLQIGVHQPQPPFTFNQLGCYSYAPLKSHQLLPHELSHTQGNMKAGNSAE